MASCCIFSENLVLYKWMKKFLLQIVSAGLGLWLSSIWIKGVYITAQSGSNFFGIPLTAWWQVLALLAIVLGLLNYFLKPLLKLLSLPLEIITLGLFTIVINMGLIWALDQMFDEFYVSGVLPLFYITVIIWALNIILNKIFIHE